MRHRRGWEGKGEEGERDEEVLLSSQSRLGAVENPSSRIYLFFCFFGCQYLEAMFLVLRLQTVENRTVRRWRKGKEQARERGSIWASSLTLIWTPRAVRSSVQPSWCHTNDHPPLPVGYKVKSPTPPCFIIPLQHPAAPTVLKVIFIALAIVQFAFLSYLSTSRKHCKTPLAQMGKVCWIRKFFCQWCCVSCQHSHVCSKESAGSSFVLC